MSALFETRTYAEAVRLQALEARRKRFEAKAIAEAEKFQVPQIGRDQIEFEWHTDCAVPIICHLDYTPEEPADHYGPAPYPGYPEEMSLRAAYVRGVDIYELLSQKQIDQIEEAALLRKYESRGDDE
jgi:hypothetical protein